MLRKSDEPVNDVNSDRAVGTEVARSLHTREVTGSIPVPPTNPLTRPIFPGWEPKSETEGYVYFIACGRYVKAGYSSVHPKRRLVAMRILNPHTCRIIGIISGGTRLERNIHRALSICRHRNEWFHLTKSTRALIGVLIERHGGEAF